MTTTINCRLLPIYFILFLFFCGCGSHTSQPHSSTDDKIVLTAIEEGNNWAFKIEVNGKLYIYQATIPAIGGNKSFKTKKDALKTGRLMVEKMKKTGELPTLSVEEIMSLNLNGL